MALVLFAFNGNASIKTYGISLNNNIKEDSTCNVKKVNIDDNNLSIGRKKDVFYSSTDDANNLGRKPWWHYAIIDAGTGKAGFEIGLTTGHPLLMSAGMVFGAVLGSSYAWYMDTHYGRMSNDNYYLYPSTHKSDFDKLGEIHNKYLDYLIKQELNPTSEEDFINHVYDELASNISKELDIDQDILKKYFTKEKAKAILKDAKELNEVYDNSTETTIKLAVEKINMTTNNELIANYINVIFNKYTKSEDIESLLSSINSEIELLKDNQTFNEMEKKYLINKLSIFIFSSYFWFSNN